MSTENVTPITAGPKTNAPKKTGGDSGGGPIRPKLEAAIKNEIGEQQSRVWCLKSLLECVRECAEGDNGCEDLRAAISGLVDYADSIHSDMDPGMLIQQAMEETKVDSTN